MARMADGKPPKRILSAVFATSRSEMRSKMINVGGFLFEDEETATQAKKEEEGVRFIKEKASLNNPEVVMKLYKTLLQQNLFTTPVGLRFLMELQSILMASEGVNKEDIPPLDTSVFFKAANVPEKTYKKKDRNYKHAFHVALFFSIVFGISVIGMFAIEKISNDNVNILNYREEIINQFEQWEKELQEEEERLKNWEDDLSEREAELNDTKEAG